MQIEFPIHVLTREGFPELSHLWQVANPPDVLYVQGTREALSLLHELPAQGLAVVGTREPHNRSAHLVRQTIHELAGTDRIIVSGFARGIDACAHDAAVLEELPTIGVLGCGLDIPYPRENQTLRQEILGAGGLLITEFPLGTEARPHHFLNRNRLIAGWARATWVVEAGIRSGALNTAKWARSQERWIFSTPSFPGDSAWAGNACLIDRDHAQVFWGTHSLGVCWLELATLAPRWLLAKLWPEALEGKRSMSDERAVGFFVHCVTARQGGATFFEVHHWATQQGWPHGRIAAALQGALQDKILRNDKGVFVTY